MVSNGGNESYWRAYLKAARAGLVCSTLFLVCGSVSAELENQVIGGNQTNSAVQQQHNSNSQHSAPAKPSISVLPVMGAIPKQSAAPNQDQKSKNFADEQTYQSSKEDNGFWNGKFTDWAIVFLTVGLFAVGIAQACIYYRQSALMRAALKETRRSNAISGKIAKISERTLTDLERPYVFVSGVENILNNVVEEAEFPVILCDISNHGRLPAVIKRCEYIFGRGDPATNRFEIPLIIASEAKHKGVNIDAYPIRPFLKGIRDDDEPRHFYDCWIPADSAFAVTSPLSLRILIYYDGPFTKGHETSSYWIYDIEDWRFRCQTDHEYTYTK